MKIPPTTLFKMSDLANDKQRILLRIIIKKCASVYELINTMDSRNYIGGTTNTYERLMRHYYDLKKGVHDSPELQNDFNRHGLAAFGFRVLRQYASDTMRNEIHFVESKYIKKLQPFYNVKSK